MDFMLTFLTDREVGATKPGVHAEMGKYSGQLAAQGKMKGGAPLKPEEEGARLRMDGGQPVVSDGPFLETKEVIGGFFMIEADSLEEAVEIAKKCPHLTHGFGPVEVREVIQVGPPS